MNDLNSFRWTRAAVHVVLIVAAVFLLTALLAGFELIPNSDEAARSVGGKLLLIAGFGGLVSYGIQKRRPFVVGLAGLLIASTVFLALARFRGEAIPLSDLERREPLRSAGSLCQTTLGVSFADPGADFVLRPDLTKTANAQTSLQNAQTWVWENTKTKERLLLQVIKGVGSTADGFRKLTAGMRSSVPKKATVTAAEIRTEEGPPYTSKLAVNAENGLAVDVGCITPESAGKTNWTACITTISSDHRSLEQARSSLKFGACGGGA